LEKRLQPFFLYETPIFRYHELSEREVLDHLVHRQRYDKREPPGKINSSFSPPRRDHPVPAAAVLVNVSVLLLAVDWQGDRREVSKSESIFLNARQLSLTTSTSTSIPFSSTPLPPEHASIPPPQSANISFAPQRTPLSQSHSLPSL